MRLFRLLLILLTACFLMASAAWADDLAFVDCSSHPDPTQVFSKARQTPDSVASIPCGERFTVLVYGFIYSRVQTRDGKVGYVLSSLISVDRAGNTGQQSASTQSLQSASMRESVGATPAVTNAVTKSAVPAPSAASPSATAPAPSQPASAPATSAAAIPASTESQPAAVQPAPAPTLPTAAQVQAATSASATQPVSSAPDPAPASAPEPAPAAVSQPQPQPDAAQPAPAPVRNASVRSSWEQPIPGARQNFLLEVFGGYSFARFTSAGSSTNLNGGMGSVGWNFKPWLQIVGDSSYNFVTVSGTKNKLYGNHFGARYYYRRHHLWSITPFVEGLIGGSRLDVTPSGAGTSSQNCLSYKAGGGVDFRASRRWEIRLINVDYYRTAFGTNATQNNYWASAGVVFRFFGGPSAE